jgi:hypothetical protein
VFATAAIAVLLGIALSAVIVTYVVRLLGLPMREALMWFGLLELDVSAAARAAERRRADLTLARRSSRPD